MGRRILREVKLVLLETVTGAISKLDVRFSLRNFFYKTNKTWAESGFPGPKKTKCLTPGKNSPSEKNGPPEYPESFNFPCQKGTTQQKMDAGLSGNQTTTFSSVHKTNPQKWHLSPKTSFSVCKNASFFPINLMTQKQIVGSWFLRAPKWGLFVLRTTPPAKFYSALVRCETPNIGVWFLRIAQAATLK